MLMNKKGGLNDRILKVSPAGVQTSEIGNAILSTPDDHLTAAPNRSEEHSPAGHIRHTRGGPTISLGVIFTPSGQVIKTGVTPAPDDHLTARPDGLVKASSRWRIRDADSGPTIRTWIVSTSGVYPVDNAGTSGVATPHDHFSTGPNCGMIGARRWRIRRTNSGPTVSGGIISA